MDRYLWIWIALVLACSSVQAHLLTGTDVATLAQLSVDHARVGGAYEIQYGELAALAERQRMDADHDGVLSPEEQGQYAQQLADQLLSHLTLEVDGRALPFRLVDGQVLPAEPMVGPGQMTLRFGIQSEPSDFTKPRRLEFRDQNQLPRLVHKDVTIEGLPLVDLDPGQVDPGTGALKQVRVQAAKEVQARVMLRPAEAAWQALQPPGAQAIGPAPPSGTQAAGSEHLQDLLRSRELSATLIAFSLALAFFLGAAHALEPGHGKTIVAAYLIGSRGTVANAVYLGSVVTFTHTFSVILLGLLTLFASQYILPEQLYPWLSAGSGLLISGLGMWLFVRALTGRGHGHRHGPFGHHHGPGHSHDHDHPRASDPGPLPLPLRPGSPLPVRGYEFHRPPQPAPERPSRGSLLTLGISGGIVPCPGALIILLLAVALHRIAFGLLLILAFSLGLAAVLIFIGVLMVKARPLLDRFSGEGRLARRLPLISSVLIMAVGLVMAVRSLMSAGILVIRRPAP